MPPDHFVGAVQVGASAGKAGLLEAPGRERQAVSRGGQKSKGRLDEGVSFAPDKSHGNAVVVTPEFRPDGHIQGKPRPWLAFKTEQRALIGAIVVLGKIQQSPL